MGTVDAETLGDPPRALSLRDGGGGGDSLGPALVGSAGDHTGLWGGSL